MRSGWTPRRLPTAHLDVSLYYSRVNPSLSAAAAPDTMQLPSRVREKEKQHSVTMHHVLLLLLFPPPSFTSFSSVAPAVSERAHWRADWLAPTFSRVPPVADYGWLCSAHIKRLLTPLLSCLLSSPPLNPTSLQPCDGMTEISIEFKTMRSDHLTTRLCPTATGLPFLRHHATLQCVRECFSFVQRRYIRDDRKPD